MDRDNKPLAPEITKLLDKLKKEPASKLFLPLAEEYAKSGLLDEALSVLKEGLQIHPSYLTARVSLGKIYLQKGLTAEAKAEFENVIKMNPDNLLAHRKLAKIYKDEGAFGQCRSSCQRVLAQSPADREMVALLQESEVLEHQRPVVTEAAAPAESPSAPKPHDALLEDSVPPAAPPSLEAAPLERATKDLMDEADFESLSIRVKTEVSLPQGIVPAPVSEDRGIAEVLAQGPSAPITPPEAVSEPALSSPNEGLLSPTLAELYISQGHLEQGIEIYRQLVEKDPQDQKLREQLLAAQTRNEQQGASVELSAAEDHGGQTDLRRQEKRQEKLRRLQSWLDNLKKGEGG